jgi:putative flippase GtrA
MLAIFHGWVGLEAVTANVSAVAVSVLPSYWATRRWVWGASPGTDHRRDLALFIGLTILGLGLSSLSVHLMSQRFDSTPMINAASFGAFGIVWVLKFFVLDSLFAERAPASTSLVPG